MLFFLKARVRFVPLTSDFSFLGTNLVKKAIYAMVEGDCDEVSRAGLFPREDYVTSVSFIGSEVIRFS